jgi:hypothetical protein
MSKQHVNVGYDAIIEHFKNVNPYKDENVG